MSGNRRADGSVAGSILRDSAYTCALSRIVERLPSMCTKRGMLTWYIEIATAFSFGTWGPSSIAHRAADNGRMEALVPSPHEFVVRRPAARPVAAGEWTLVDETSGTWVLRARDARTDLLPLLRDRDGVAHYPTGEVTVRFAQSPADDALARSRKRIA